MSDDMAGKLRDGTWEALVDLWPGRPSGKQRADSPIRKRSGELLTGWRMRP
jgi:hypothetical protein